MLGILTFTGFVASSGYLAIFLLSVAQSCCVPTSSELTMGFAGVLAASGKLNLAAVIAVGVTGEVVGAYLAWVIGRTGGRRFVDRWGKFVLLSHTDLDRAEEWYERHERWGVFGSRLVPLVRNFAALPAGVAEVPLLRFGILTAAGSLIWDGAMAGIGYGVGSGWRSVVHGFSDAGYLFGVVAVLIIAFVIFHRYRSYKAAASSPPGSPAGAGYEARTGGELASPGPRRPAHARTSRSSLRPLLDKTASLLHVDFAPTHRQPLYGRVVLATLVSLGGSLLADAVLVVIGQSVFPSTKGYAHFQFSDYGKLTVIGVIIACIAWPIVTRVSSLPRWLFFRLAIVVTLVLWLPDLYILAQGQPPKAVGFLMLMHLAIALVTYNALVHIAPVRRPRRQRPTRPQTEGQVTESWPGQGSTASSGVSPREEQSADHEHGQGVKTED